MNRREVLIGGACAFAFAGSALAQTSSLVGEWSGLIPGGPQTVRVQVLAKGKVKLVTPQGTVYNGKAESLAPGDLRLYWRYPRPGWRFIGRMVSPDLLEGRIEQGARVYGIAFAKGRTPAPLVATLSTATALTQEKFEAMRAKAGLKAFGAVAASRRGASRYWLANASRNDPVKPQTPWKWASVTKSMTATLVARMQEAGVISWDDTVGDLLGQVAPGMVSAYRPVTFRRLLTHRSGMPRDLMKLSPSLTRIDYVREALSMPAIGPMDTASWHYSNNGYITAGAMLQVKTGEPWEALMRKYVFAPLGMQTADLGGTSIDPAGGVRASLSDMLLYLAAHRDGTAFLKPETWKTLHSDPYGGDYAMGWEMLAGGLLMHGGNLPGWTAQVLVDPNGGIVSASATISSDWNDAAYAAAVGAWEAAKI